MNIKSRVKCAPVYYAMTHACTPTPVTCIAGSGLMILACRRAEYIFAHSTGLTNSSARGSGRWPEEIQKSCNELLIELYGRVYEFVNLSNGVCGGGITSQDDFVVCHI